MSDETLEVGVVETTLPKTRLTEAQVVDLVTYRKDGTPVHTPVLSTPHDGALLVRTHHTAGKLKRLKNNPRVTVAACYGRSRRGPAEAATAVILPGSQVSGCLTLLHHHHGLIGRAATWLRHLRGMQDVFIEVRPA